MSDNIDDTARRFEIFVPSPKARINMGAANTDPNTGPFGYTGLSLQSDANILIDGNKNTLYQTGQSFCGQVGGQWRQFSNAPMFLSATANVTLAADTRVIIASGAGQGQITALDHGQKMRLVPYNELKLHYLVDSLQVSLFEFFNGRHGRTDKKFGLVRPVKMKNFYSARNRLASLTATAGKLLNDGTKPHEGGFLDTVARSWVLLENAVEEDALAGGGPKPEGIPTLAPLLDAGIAKAGAGAKAKLKFGYSGYLGRFDPYAIKEGGLLNLLHRLVVMLKRYLHVALKYGQAVQDLPFIRNAIKGLEGAGNLVTATFQAYHAATDSYPALLAFKRVQGHYAFEAGSGGVADEALSGPAARVKGVVDSTADTRQAKVETSAQPAAGWPLAEGTLYELHVAWADGAKQRAIRVSRSGPLPATMQVTAPALSNDPETFVLALSIAGADVDVTLDPASTASVAAFEAALAAALATHPVEVRASAETVTIAARMASPLALRDTPANRRYARRLGVPLDAMGTNVPELPLTPPALSAQGEQIGLVLTVDGQRILATHTSSTTLASVLGASSELDLLATVSGSGNGPITITTRTQRSASRIHARVDDAQGWTFSASHDERGTDSHAAQITADEIAALIGSLDGVAVSVKDGKVTFEASKTGSGSTVTVSGNLASLVFGSASKTDTIGGDPSIDETAGFATFDDAFKTVVSWNHELQKLPEDTRNLTRPLTEALDDTVAAVTAIEGAVKSFQEVFEQGPPAPPEAIGLLAPGGITLGTKDRIVGHGGKGIVLIADGGTGQPDRAKFVLTESWVADLGAWSANFFATQAEKPVRSLGFRVLSDSAVDLTATSYAQLSAMGRGGAKQARADGRKDGVGIGIARVVGSYASEVAGYEKVIISARAPGTAGDETGLTGGRVEVLGQHLLIGAVDSEVSLTNGTKQKLSDRATLGTEAFSLESLAGAEHLADGGDASDKAYVKSPTDGIAWSTFLRAKHPLTTHVDVHAKTRLESVVLPYRLSLSPERARLGVTSPVEGQKAELKKARDDADAHQNMISQLLTTKQALLVTTNAAIVQLGLDLQDVTKVLQTDANTQALEEAKLRRDSLTESIQVLTTGLQEATQLALAATNAHATFVNDWDGKAFPVLEVTEDKIRLGFVAGDATWEDFAFLEITKDGIKMFQPKAQGVPSFDLASKAGLISDGTKDTVVEASNGQLNLKFKNAAKSGPLTWDAQGNVKIG